MSGRLLLLLAALGIATPSPATIDGALYLLSSWSVHNPELIFLRLHAPAGRAPHWSVEQRMPTFAGDIPIIVADNPPRFMDYPGGHSVAGYFGPGEVFEYSNLAQRFTLHGAKGTRVIATANHDISGARIRRVRDDLFQVVGALEPTKAFHLFDYHGGESGFALRSPGTPIPGYIATHRPLFSAAGLFYLKDVRSGSTTERGIGHLPLAGSPDFSSVLSQLPTFGAQPTFEFLAVDANGAEPYVYFRHGDGFFGARLDKPGVVDTFSRDLFAPETFRRLLGGVSARAAFSSLDFFPSGARIDARDTLRAWFAAGWLRVYRRAMPASFSGREVAQMLEADQMGMDWLHQLLTDLDETSRGALGVRKPSTRWESTPTPVALTAEKLLDSVATLPRCVALVTAGNR